MDRIDRGDVPLLRQRHPHAQRRHARERPQGALRKAVNGYIETHDIKIKGLKITAEDIREGVVAVLSVFVREPQFEGQTKQRLNNPEMDGAVDNFVRPALEAWLNNNKTAADAIIGRIVLAAKAREASRAAVTEVKREFARQPPHEPARASSPTASPPTATRPSCSSSRATRPAGRPSRGGTTTRRPCCRCAARSSTARTCRPRRCSRTRKSADLVKAIGTGAGDKFHYDGLRYGKIILLMDADADGHHITTLMLDFFLRHAPELISKGHVYIAQPPLYRIDVGKETHWAQRRRAQGGDPRRAAGEREAGHHAVQGARRDAVPRCWRRRRSTRSTGRC